MKKQNGTSLSLNKATALHRAVNALLEKTTETLTANFSGMPCGFRCAQPMMLVKGGERHG